MHRRTLLARAGVAAAGTLLHPLRAVAGTIDDTPLPLDRAAAEACVYVLPLVELALSRAVSYAGGARPNRVFHDRALATPAFRSVTTPNNDTLYSRAWLDLTAGPVTIDLPPTGERYFSAAFLDMYSNNFAVLGMRTTGGGGGRYTLVGPSSAGAGPGVLRSPTPHAWLVARTLVAGPGDLAAVHALQDRMAVRGPDRPIPAAAPDRDAPWDVFFAGAQRLLTANPPPATDRRLLRRIARLGLDARGGFDARRFSADDARAIAAGLSRTRTALTSGRRGGTLVDGWLYPQYDMGDFGQDYSYRAQVALGGLGALPRVEAMYMRAISPEGTTFFRPGGAYRMTFSADALPPVDGFWSLTMYEHTEDGRFFLAANAEDRYSIGDRTGTLIRRSDGALELVVGADRPAGDNWLPAPAGKPFGLVFRAYLPDEAMLLGRYHLPPMVPFRSETR